MAEMTTAMIQSMSRKANCRDNASIDSFLGTLKTARVRQREYFDRHAAQRDMFAYVEGRAPSGPP